MAAMDPVNLSTWFDSHSAQLLLYARQWLPEPSAEDVVQTVFLRLMSQPRRPDDVKAWLFRAVRNAAISHLRSHRRRRRREQVVAARKRPWFRARPDDPIDAATAQAALSHLPDRLRETAVLRIWGQMTFREIAGVVGRPVSTVVRDYRAALTAVRERLESSCRTRPQ